MNNPTKQKALEYIRLGWSIFPVKSMDKIPATPNGVKDATNSLDVAETSFVHSDVTYNIGVATGLVSGVVVLDIDGEKGLKSLKLLEKEFGELGPEYVCKTPSGGLHYYFKAPDESLKNRVGIFPGIDFRACGGYVVAPPSTGKNSVQYEWLIKPSGTVPELPLWVKTLVTEITNETTNLIDSDGMVVEGQRNAYLFKMGCRLRRSGLSQSAIAEALSSENDERCLPPVSPREVKAITLSSMKYKPTDPVVVEEGDNAKDPLTISAKDLVGSMCEYLRDKDKVKGQSFFMPAMDKLMGGGMRTGELNVWHAHAKTGKNTLWHKLLHLQMINDVANAYASRELTPETEVMPNMYSIHFQENIWLSQNIDEERFRVAVENWPLSFCRGYGYLPLDDMKRWVCSLKRRGVDYFWFDHLHYMLEDPEDHKAASKLIKELKTLTKEEDICVNLIVQPNKMMEGQGLSLNSLKGGSAIGQALDNLIVLERHYNYEGVMVVKLEAARSKLCNLGKFNLKYNTETTDMEEVDVHTLPPINSPYECAPPGQLTPQTIDAISRQLFLGGIRE